MHFSAVLLDVVLAKLWLGRLEHLLVRLVLISAIPSEMSGSGLSALVAAVLYSIVHKDKATVGLHLCQAGFSLLVWGSARAGYLGEL